MFKTFLSEFADLLKLVFDGVVMASNQEQGVVAGTRDCDTSQDPNRGDTTARLKHEMFEYQGQTD